MQLSLSKAELQSYVCNQLNNFFPDNHPVKPAEFDGVLNLTLDRVNFCFKKVAFERYNKNGETILNHLYADQYLVFLWFLSNTLWKEKGHLSIASKLYYLNKTLHAFDCMYDTALPDIFLIFHGAGTVLGKAIYNDYFVSLQGCTIGSHKGKYPIIGKGVGLTAHSCIVGNCEIGDRVSVSIYTTVFEKNVPNDTTAFTDTSSGKVCFKPSKRPYAQQFFNIDLDLV
jgi:serine O-acetyltransferase